jgi:hypothetical protein
MASKPPRELSTAMLFGVAAVILVSLFSVLLALSYRSDLMDLRRTLAERCETRARIDAATNESVKADALLYRQLLEIADRAPKQADPALRALVAEQRAVIREAQVRKEAAASAGTVGTCAAYR